MSESTQTQTEPLPEAVAALVSLAKRGVLALFQSTPGTFIVNHAYALDAAGTVHVLMLPAADMRTARGMLRSCLPGVDAVAVAHVVEAYTAGSAEPAQAAALAALAAHKRLQDAPKDCLREAVILFVEAPTIPARVETCAISVAEDGTRTLGAEWEQMGVRLPYPSFRRYFPDCPDVAATNVPLQWEA